MPPAKVRMVRGPAVVTVRGTCYVLGVDVSGQKITIRPGKVLPFETAGRCRLRTQLGRGGKIWWANARLSGTSIWRDIARRVLSLAENKRVIVMLVGATDTGKSTFSTYLANIAFESGFVPAIIDGDLGQGDLGPPTSMGAAILSRQTVDLRDIICNLFEFVGSTSPLGYEQIVAGKLKSMLEKVESLADICIVNTDGYVSSGGARYKLMIAKEIQPDVIVCLGKDELSKMLGAWNVIHARPSRVLKSRYTRKTGRLSQFLRHAGSGSSVAALSHVTFVYKDRLFSDSELSLPPIRHLERENLKRMFVGVGSENCIDGFGIVTDVTQSEIFVQTDVDTFAFIYLSDIRLRKDEVSEIKIT